MCKERIREDRERIREAKEDKGNLAIVWLDLANAYGSVPHRLIERAMVQYGIPNKIQDIILRYYSNIKRFKQQVSSGLGKIERSLLPVKYKLWCYQHGLLPRLSWPMLMYDIPVSTVESIQKTVNRWLRIWLRVPQSFSEINLYSTTCKL